MSKLKEVFFIVVIFFILISCKNTLKKEQSSINSYYTTGELKSTIIFDAKINKKYGRFFYLNGSLEKEISLLNDEIVDTLKTYYQNGALKSKVYYKFGKAEGQAFWYHANGNLEETVNYQNDKSDGLLSAFLPSGKLDFINYFKDGFLYYVKYYERNTFGDVIRTSENYIPKVNLTKDNCNYGDTLTVDFYLNLPKDSIQHTDFFIKFDFFNGSKLPNNLGYPAYELVIENGKASQSFVIKDSGNQILHGAIFTKKGDVEKYYKRFSKHFYVKEPL